jgi:hypothetical protein
MQTKGIYTSSDNADGQVISFDLPKERVTIIRGNILEKIAEDDLWKKKIKLNLWSLNDKEERYLKAYYFFQHLFEVLKMQTVDLSIEEFPAFESLQRCTKCVLPYTFPNLDLDDNGVCHYCRSVSNESSLPLGVPSLLNALGVDIKNVSGNHILVGVSGGRDSCYGLHYLSKVLHLNVIAYTYDWGMVTDLARRNIARVCGQLGIEHIIVAPNTSKKLRNVRLNIQAWQKKPRLGLIPLLMAGDKQFYLYAHKLRKERGAVSTVLCAGNKYEITDFKVAFSGVVQSKAEGTLRDTSTKQALNLLKFYMFETIKNPRYLNRSLIDTISAYRSSYF